MFDKNQIKNLENPAPENPNPENIIQYLQEARQGAMEAKQFSTVVRASELLGKHLGMFGKKPEGNGHIIVRWADEDE